MTEVRSTISQEVGMEKQGTLEEIKKQLAAGDCPLEILAKVDTGEPWVDPLLEELVTEAKGISDARVIADRAEDQLIPGHKKMLQKVEDEIADLKSRLAEYLGVTSGLKEAVSPPGWKHTVEHMKKHKHITNPWALAWWQKGQGHTPHITSNRHSLAYVDPMEHERYRISYMTDPQLRTRMFKIKSVEKMKNFITALIEAGKEELAREAEFHLKSMTNAPLYANRHALVKKAGGFSPEQMQKFMTWIDENVTKKGLIPTTQMTAFTMAGEFPELGRDPDERAFYAQQIIKKYNQEHNASVKFALQAKDNVVLTQDVGMEGFTIPEGTSARVTRVLNADEAARTSGQYEVMT